jgi:DNA-binding NarL/FixJ family response regulator
MRMVGFTVLIVDDHPGFRSWCRRLLEAEGVVVVADVGDGASALSSVRLLRPDIALIDIRLPDMDGFEVAERLRAGAAVATVIMTSTRDVSEYEGRLTQCGIAGFIPKAELSVAALVGFLGLDS